MNERDIYQKILENSDIYKDYKAERKKYLKSKDTNENFNFVFHYMPSEWILQAFEFSNTSRYDYWRDINREWDEFIKGKDTSFIGKHTKYSNEKVGFALQAVDYKYGEGYNIPKTDEEYENVLKHCSFYAELIKKYNECFASFSKIARYYWIDRITDDNDAYWSKINKAWKAFHNATANDDPDHILHPFYAIREYYNPYYDYSNDIVENDEYEIVEEDDKIVVKSKDDFIEIITHCSFFPELVKEIENNYGRGWKDELNKTEIGYWISGLFTWEDTNKWSSINNAWLKFCGDEKHDLEVLKKYYNSSHDYSKDFKGLEAKELKSEYKMPKTKDDFIEIIKHCSFYPELATEFYKHYKGEKSFEEILNLISKELFTDTPIKWDKTANGRDYWHKIDTAWAHFCDSTEDHSLTSKEIFDHISEYYDPNHDYSKDLKSMINKELKDFKKPTTKEDFIKVLKHCNFYPILASEAKKQRNLTTFDDYLTTHEKDEFTNCSIDWIETVHGCVFWKKIDDDWQYFCNCAEKRDINIRDLYYSIKEYYDPDHDYSKDTDALGTAMEKEFSEKVKNANVEPNKNFKVTTRKPKLNKLNFKL